MTVHQTLLPPGWPRPKGYANGIAASGRMIFTGGLVGWDAEERFATGLAGQFRQVLQNMLAVLNEAGAGPEHLVRLTWYITDRDDYIASLPAIGTVYRELIGKNFPAMAVVQVAALVEAAALMEIEATAVLPEA
ncbi:RidA family protein [Sphingobium boeckii]|uniref:Enamine deaminase RidA (YjgF/YER057c/UK114 family) n=1 Tax=Sphingobium boeckii TaxID=1082345 RepID=A0A7W9EGA2_9SPHN|nr:RidA family protein [Sphingobium boeckii]MBB5686885.1 enamine deaminase RidA (YjgF/YER057c/UK114 family) [Sphingobium boeckii]